LRFFAPVLADASRFIDAESDHAAQRGEDSTQTTVGAGNVYPLNSPRLAHADTTQAASSAHAPEPASGSSSLGHAE
jgi:hypothetical protein